MPQLGQDPLLLAALPLAIRVWCTLTLKHVQGCICDFPSFITYMLCIRWAGAPLWICFRAYIRAQREAINITVILSYESRTRSVGCGHIGFGELSIVPRRKPFPFTFHTNTSRSCCCTAVYRQYGVPRIVVTYCTRSVARRFACLISTLSLDAL